MNPSIQLKGRVFIRFDIEAVTGLHIGGSDTGIEIGGVDKTVIRDPYSNRPYIPGSSLKGKMRSLVEKRRGLKQNQPIGQGRIHSCGGEYKDKKELDQKGRQEYLACDVCQVFGVPGERPFSTPTRLVVRDVHLSKEWADKLNASGRTDLPYTEIKTEVSIDRVTSAAHPRQMERVPAGVVFGGQDDHGKPQPAELVYSIYDGGDCSTSKDVTRLRTVFEGLQLLEDDYLGGLGSRGSGKVRLHNICIELRDCKEALAESRSIGKPVYADLNEAIRDLTNLDKALQEAFK